MKQLKNKLWILIRIKQQKLERIFQVHFYPVKFIFLIKEKFVFKPKNENLIDQLNSKLLECKILNYY